MALTGLHTNWLKGSYQADRNFILMMGENDKLYKGVVRTGESWVFGTKPYYDGSIAIGYGFDLLSNDIQYVDYFLRSAGIVLTQSQLDAISAAKGNANEAMANQIGQFLNLNDEATARQLMVNVLDSTSPLYGGKETELDTFLQSKNIVK